MRICSEGNLSLDVLILLKSVSVDTGIVAFYLHLIHNHIDPAHIIVDFYFF